jgi:esterase/lipase superfamily enzyme
MFTSKWLPVRIPVLIVHAQVSSFQAARVVFRLHLSLSRIVTLSCTYAVRVRLVYKIMYPNIPTSLHTAGINTNHIQ